MGSVRSRAEMYSLMRNMEICNDIDMVRDPVVVILSTRILVDKYKAKNTRQ